MTPQASYVRARRARTTAGLALRACLLALAWKVSAAVEEEPCDVPPCPQRLPVPNANGFVLGNVVGVLPLAPGAFGVESSTAPSSGEAGVDDEVVRDALGRCKLDPC